MLSVRMLLGGKKNKDKKRKLGLGGKFVDDIAQLSTDNFMNFYIRPDSVLIPPILLAKAVKENPDNKLNFVKNNCDVIE